MFILYACGPWHHVRFHGNSSHYFSQRSFWATAGNTPEPASGACPLEQYLQRRKYHTIAKHRVGLGWGDGHCPLRKQVLYHLLKTQGFTRAEIRNLEPFPEFLTIPEKPKL